MTRICILQQQLVSWFSSQQVHLGSSSALSVAHIVRLGCQSLQFCLHSTGGSIQLQDARVICSKEILAATQQATLYVHPRQSRGFVGLNCTCVGDPDRYLQCRSSIIFSKFTRHRIKTGVHIVHIGYQSLQFCPTFQSLSKTSSATRLTNLCNWRPRGSVTRYHFLMGRSLRHRIFLYSHVHIAYDYVTILAIYTHHIWIAAFCILWFNGSLLASFLGEITTQQHVEWRIYSAGYYGIEQQYFLILAG